MWHCRRIPLHQQYARCILMRCTSPDTQETGPHAALPRGAHLRAQRPPGLLFKARRLREPTGPARAPPTKLRAAPAPPAPPQPQGRRRRGRPGPRCAERREEPGGRAVRASRASASAPHGSQAPAAAAPGPGPALAVPRDLFSAMGSFSCSADITDSSAWLPGRQESGLFDAAAAAAAGPHPAPSAPASSAAAPARCCRSRRRPSSGAKRLCKVWAREGCAAARGGGQARRGPARGASLPGGRPGVRGAPSSAGQGPRRLRAPASPGPRRRGCRVPRSAPAGHGAAQGAESPLPAGSRVRRGGSARGAPPAPAMSAAGPPAPAAPPLGTKAPRWGGSAGATTLGSATAGARSGRGTAAGRAGTSSARGRGGRGGSGAGAASAAVRGESLAGTGSGPRSGAVSGATALLRGRTCLTPAPRPRAAAPVLPAHGAAPGLKGWSPALRRLPGRRGSLRREGLPSPRCHRQPGLWPGGTAQTAGPSRCPHSARKPCVSLENTRGQINRCRCRCSFVKTHSASVSRLLKWPRFTGVAYGVFDPDQNC